MSEDVKAGKKAPKTVIEQAAAAAGASAKKGRAAKEGASDKTSPKRPRPNRDEAGASKGLPGTMRAVRDVLGDTDEHIGRYAGSHRNTVLFGLIGLVAALAVLFLGFWRTLVIAVFVLVGVIIGQALDGDNGIINFFRRHFGGR